MCWDMHKKYCCGNGSNLWDAGDLRNHRVHYDVIVMYHVYVTQRNVNTHLTQFQQLVNKLISSWTKWPPFCRRYFQTHFHEGEVYFNSSFTELCSMCPIDNKSALVQVMTWRRVITWTNDDPVHQRMYAALGGGELRQDVIMMTSSNGNIFRVTGHLCGEFTGPRWILHTKASDAELWCLLWSASE